MRIKAKMLHRDLYLAGHILTEQLRTQDRSKTLLFDAFHFPYFLMVESIRYNLYFNTT
jgi:hypothetical protein